MSKLENIHNGMPNEYADKCRRCNGEIELIREGTLGNPVSDLSECDCAIIEHSNSADLGVGTVTIGINRVVKNKSLTIHIERH